jgi:hypothetical protein
MNKSKHMKEAGKKTVFAGWDDSRLLPQSRKENKRQTSDNLYKTQAVQVGEGLEDLLPGNNTLHGHKTLGDMNYNYLRNQFDKYLLKKTGEETVAEVEGYTSHELMYTMLGLGSKRADDKLAVLNHSKLKVNRPDTGTHSFRAVLVPRSKDSADARHPGQQ